MPATPDVNDQQSRALSNIDTLIAYLEDKRENMVFFALNQLKALSSNNETNKDLICAKGAIPLCMPLLYPSQKNMIHDKALRLLRSLSVTEKNQTIIASAGAIPLLLNFVRGTDANLQVNAVAILWNLSVHAENKEAVGRHGGLDALVKLLCQTDRENVRNEIVGALRNLSHHAPNRARIVRSGGIEPLLKMLDPAKARAATRRHALVALVQCANDPEGLSAIRRFGANTVAMLEQTCHEIDSQLYQELKQTLDGGVPPTVGAGAATVAGGGAVRSGRAAHNNNNNGNNNGNNGPETTLVRETMANEEMCMPFATDTFGTMQWPAIELEEKIGSGAYSVVYKARYHGYPVAVKILNDPLPDDPNRREKMMLEFKLMSMLRHPNCLLYMGSAISPENKLAIISELAIRGTLKDCMVEVKNMTQRLKFGKDIVHGLCWMHANNIVHRDLKPANILISADWSARISDLGLSLVYHTDCVCMRFKGNVKYSAPEILAVRAQSDRKKTNLTYAYGPQTDVYSWSLILWELVTNEPLFEGIRGKEEITDFVCSGKRPELVPGWPKSLTTLLERSWHQDPSQRMLFPYIQAQFSNVMIDFLCPDPVGRRIARDIYLGDETRRVPYAQFEEAFQERCGIDLNTGSQCYRRCLQAMLCDPHTMLVSFEQWCNCIHWMGAMTPIKDFLNRLVRLFEQPWFFGFIQNKDAKRLLLEQQRRVPDAPGYYLIRFSENWPGSFTIYSVDSSGQTSHRRISHQYSSNFCVTFDGVAGREFPDLFTLHDQCCETGTCLQGLSPLPGAPYQHFFATHPLRQSNQQSATNAASSSFDASDEDKDTARPAVTAATVAVGAAKQRVPGVPPPVSLAAPLNNVAKTVAGGGGGNGPAQRTSPQSIAVREGVATKSPQQQQQQTVAQRQQPQGQQQGQQQQQQQGQQQQQQQQGQTPLAVYKMI